MAHLSSLRAPSCCWRSFVRDLKVQLPAQRSLATLQAAPVQKLEVPGNLPKQFWSQLPPRLRPDHEKREITVHEAPPSEREACKDPVKVIENEQMALLDPSGARARLFDPKNRDGAKPGDILLATFRTGEPFSGVAISIKWRGPHTSVLLRNHLTRIGTEMDIKVFSPLVQSIEIAQKSLKRKRRARLYYMRKPEHDMGSVQKVVDQYLRQRALLTGGRASGASRSSGAKGKKR